jgi:hypothetical protein
MSHAPQLLGEAIMHITGIASEQYLHCACKVRLFFAFIKKSSTFTTIYGSHRHHTRV